MTQVIIGIDPGQKGAAAILLPQSTQVHTLEVFDLKHLRVGTHIFLEKAHAMPKQGVSSMFNYGVGFGRLIGWIEAMGVPYTLVTSPQWMKVMHQGCDGKLTTKERSFQACARLFPGVNLLATDRSKKPHDGMAEALLIAEYGRRTLTA